MSLDIQGKLFVITVSLLALIRSGIVLGCDWLQSLGDISVNFDMLNMSFSLPSSEKCELVGDDAGALKPAALYSMICLMTSGQPSGILLTTSAELAREETQLQIGIVSILQDYQDIFLEPNDHRIPLILGVAATNVQSY